MKSYQPSFFDDSERITALRRLGDPLMELSKHIDFEMFRPKLEEALRKEERKSPAGRKPLDVILMFKAIFLQKFYNISDEQLEFQITDRCSFTNFLGLHGVSKIPDFTTFWKFRDQLATKGIERELFDLFHAKLEQEGVFAKAGSIVDATIVEVPRQRNSRKENVEIKAGQIPKEWENNAHKLSHKDTDARWLKKNGENFFGYKDHIKTDAVTVLITDYRVTDASVHDSVVLNEMLGEKDKGQSLHADSAYKSQECDEMLGSMKIENQIHEKGKRGTALTQVQLEQNRQKSKIRALVEHVFGFMENSMNGIFMRCIGVKRARCHIGLVNLTYNICRYSQLIRLNRVKIAV
jgi:IS5 family transposase